MFSLPMWITWLILCGFFFLIEIFTIAFLMFWPGVAAFVAFILAILNVPTQIQITVFAILSILLILLTKPLTNKLFKTKDTPTNARSIIGKNGIVLKTIDNLNCKGQVKVAGEIWSAASSTDEIIPVDTSVVVESIDGVKIKVKKV
ncbi:MAG: NfeD-like C-terminal, partner-binding [Clostridia bacterium]|nr:NfeD-like C-terminal, partner-binding [Clostridia bacterium]